MWGAGWHRDPKTLRVGYPPAARGRVSLAMLRRTTGALRQRRELLRLPRVSRSPGFGNVKLAKRRSRNPKMFPWLLSIGAGGGRIRAVELGEAPGDRDGRSDRAPSR